MAAARAQVRPVFGDHLLVGKPPEAARQLGAELDIVSEVRGVTLRASGWLDLLSVLVHY
jgi:hypothetical protein